MSTVISHRGNLVGPCPSAENCLLTVRAALTCGWGLETDIRRAEDGRFYISHDPRSSTEGFLAEDFCAIFRAHPASTIALNIKELGSEAALIAFLEDQGVLTQTYLFDMELLEEHAGATARRFRDLHPTIRLAARISDRGESVERALGIDVASVIWLDEFDGPCFTAADIRRLKEAGRTVHAVSPDLHCRPAEDTRARWMDFIQWGVDGICTDYPAALAYVLRTAGQEAAA
jgi:glycerophosphoryl diester phosphodiesterase